MHSHAVEPIVPLDDINSHDTFALEAPVERAVDVVAAALKDDP